jgi:hypothetical protein
MAILKFEPAVIADAVTGPEARNVPPDDADHSEQCVYVSDVDTEVQLIAALFVADPPVGVDQVPDATRTLFPAMFAVPADPGAPTCSCT